MTQPFKTRISKIIPKGGGATIHLFDTPKNNERSIIERPIRETLDLLFETQDAPIAGCAFIVWDANGASIVHSNITSHNKIPEILLPDFFRARFLARTINRWTLEDVSESLGIPFFPAS